MPRLHNGCDATSLAPLRPEALGKPRWSAIARRWPAGYQLRPCKTLG
jgi:hypothetical protein